MNHQPFAPNEVRIAVIGGGTGSFTLLAALKAYTSQIAAIVNMADDGGSTGQLRDELGVLPPGDVRQCLVALSDSPRMRDLFNYRFDSGTLEGHSFGNLFLTALERMSGSFAEAVDTASEILRVNGVVVPATFDNVRLEMSWPNATTLTLKGERVIDEEHFKRDPRKATLSLAPRPNVNPTAIEAIEQADIVVIAPGDLYTSLGPLLVIDGIGEALRRTDATVVYVSNLVTKSGQTTNFSVVDHASEIERFAGGECIDVVLYNDQQPSKALAGLYEAEQAYIVVPGEGIDTRKYRAVGGAFLGEMAKREDSDSIARRNLIRHDPIAVAQAIMDLKVPK